MSSVAFPNIILGTVITFTVATSGYATFKLAQNVPTTNNVLKEIGLGKTDNSSSNPLNNSDSAQNGNSDTGSNACIVTLFSKQYDVTTLRDTHSGGDVFNCGTDMSSEYRNEHGTDLTRMQKYLVTSSGNSSTTTTTTTSSLPSGTFNATTLATHNTTGNCYVAYSGKVYNVTNHSSWVGCTHHGIRGGIDITSRFPHPTSYLSSLAVVGTYVGGTSTFPSNPSGSTDDDDHDEVGDEQEDEQEHEDENEIEDVEDDD